MENKTKKACLPGSYVRGYNPTFLAVDSQKRDFACEAAKKAEQQLGPNYLCAIDVQPCYYCWQWYSRRKNITV